MTWDSPELCENHFTIQTSNRLKNIPQLNESSKEYLEYNRRRQLETEIESTAINIGKKMSQKIFSSNPPRNDDEEKRYFDSLIEMEMGDRED